VFSPLHVAALGIKVRFRGSLRDRTATKTKLVLTRLSLSRLTALPGGVLEFLKPPSVQEHWTSDEVGY
jgi:hypothetical protein